MRTQVLIDKEFVDKFGIVERAGDSLAGFGVDIRYHFPHAVVGLLLGKILRKGEKKENQSFWEQSTA